MENKYVILCVGYTHTGKTMFAKKLMKSIPSLINIDNDEIAFFLNEKFKAAVLSSYSKNIKTHGKNKLKYLIVRDIFKFCLKTNLNIILSGGHGKASQRSFIFNEARKYEHKSITIYFNLERKVILKRLNETKKDTGVFVYSKNWQEAFKRQESYVELPPSRKNTIYFEIKNSKDYQEVFNKVRKLLSKK